MLSNVQTPVVANYDIDIILSPERYNKCQDLILSGQDLVYPYFWGNSQMKVGYSGRDKVIAYGSLDGLIVPDDMIPERSEYGHCQFFNTNSYRAGGMENEGFISYAPEDAERGYRFKKMGYNVMWSDGNVFHLEHTRGINSSGNNPHMKQNNDLFEYIKTLDTEQLREYYKNIDYRKKYL